MPFWKNLPKPFFAMAPMADVTDPAFRKLVARCGKPDVSWTEFVSADGLYHTRQSRRQKSGPRPQASGKIPDGENPLMRDLAFSEEERPIVAQIFSAKPELIAYGAQLAKELGFDGVDLNMGCPDRSIEKQGAGAALIKSPKLAVELIEAAKSSGLPVSVKTRIGYNTDVLDEWLTAIFEARPAAVTLHLRTRKQMSLVPADWQRMKKAVELRDRLAPGALLIGNGDVMSTEEGECLALDTGCDGIMIGRGMFGNPWVFEGLRKSLIGSGFTKSEHGLEEKLATLLELAHDFEQLSPPKHFAILKKHIKAFVTGFAGAADLRAQLMEANSAAELEKSIQTHYHKNPAIAENKG